MSKRDELAAVLEAALRESRMTAYEDGKGGWLFRSATTIEQTAPLADAVLAWLGEQFDEGLREACARAILTDDLAKERAADEWAWADQEWLRDNADAALAVVRERLGLSDAAQDAQDGAVGPGSVRMGTGEGAAPNGAQIEDFEGER